MDKQAIDYAIEEIRGLTETNLTKMLAAFIEADDELTVNYSVKYAPGKAAGSTVVTTQITFIESRVKQSVKNLVGGKQRVLELHMKRDNERKPRKGDGSSKYNSLF